jgi:hypothetical protein
MRKIVSSAAAALLFLALTNSSQATPVSFSGTLSLTLGPGIIIPIQGSGTATVNQSMALGHVINYLTIPAGAFATAANTVNVPGTVITKVKVPNGISNLQIAVNAGGVCTRTHVRVVCPGGGLAGFGGLNGTLSLIGPANLSVPLPLSRVGAGSVTENPFATLFGAGWTTGVAKVTDYTVGGTVLTTTGSLYLNQNSTTFNTDTITLVSPIQIRVSAANTFLPSVAILTLHLPEPGAAVLALAGLATVSALFGWSRRRNR